MLISCSKVVLSIVLAYTYVSECTGLSTYPPGPFTPQYVDGSGYFSRCKKTTDLFGVVICYTTKAWNDGGSKVDHIAHVLGQYLDNNADGVADDPALVQYMVNNKYFMMVPYDWNDYDSAPLPDGYGQAVRICAVALNSCRVPSNRGASDTDRSTWPAAVDNTPGSTGCNPESDESIEEIHHLINDAAANFYPEKWSADANSEAGSLILALNGNCGWGYTGNWINPGGANSQCTGTYAYNDETCDVNCLIIEGVYWASVSWIGGLYTTNAAFTVGNEWLMTVPDAGMTALPATYSNAITLEEGAPQLFQLISDTTSVGNKWLPQVMPNGAYNVLTEGTYLPTPPPVPTPSPTNIVCPGNDEGEYCDCSYDCTNNPNFCSCEAAQACCGGPISTPTKKTSPPTPAPIPPPTNIVCPGNDESEYCDCSDDCNNNPNFCSCDAAQACCGGPISTPTKKTSPPTYLPKKNTKKPKKSTKKR